MLVRIQCDACGVRGDEHAIPWDDAYFLEHLPEGWWFAGEPTETKHLCEKCLELQRGASNNTAHQ